MAFVNAELLIEFAIRIGIDDLVVNHDLVEQIFFANPKTNMGQDLTNSKVATIADEFQARLSAIRTTNLDPNSSKFRNTFTNNTDVIDYLTRRAIQIIHGFPRSPEDVPCISITLGGESEDDYIGDSLGDLIDPDDGIPREWIGARWPGNYSLAILTTSYNETWLLYNVIKYAILKWRPAFEVYNWRNVTMHWMDMEPAPEYLQAGQFIYQRVCSLSGEKGENIVIVPQGTFTAVEGVTVYGEEMYAQEILPEE